MLSGSQGGYCQVAEEDAVRFEVLPVNDDDDFNVNMYGTIFTFIYSN